MDPRRLVSGLVLLAAGLLTIPGSSLAQVDLGQPAPTPTRVFLSIGVGPGLQGLGGQVSLSVHRGRAVFLLRSAADAEINIFGPSSGSSDVAFLMGKWWTRSRGWMRLALGPSWVERVEEGRCLESAFIFCGSRETNREHSIGLASQADAVWAPLSFLGVGAGLFANLNSARSFGGATLTVHLGRVR